MFNSLFSRTPLVSLHQKSQTILDFNEAKNGVAVATAEPCANHLTSLQTENHARSLNLLQTDALPDAKPTVSKHRRHLVNVFNNY